MSAPYAADMAAVGALIGDRTRATMLSALMSGSACTAGELARHAGVSPATASAHLARLLDGELLTVTSQGRHRYYRLAGQHVAAVLEALARISPPVRAIGLRQVRVAEALARARTCYDHLAGRAGVALYQTLVDKGWLTEDGGTLTESGDVALTDLGLDIARLRRGRRRLVRPCIDWTERRPHLAGAVGAALLAYTLDRAWFIRLADQRALRLTAAGEHGLVNAFGVDLDAPINEPVADGASAFDR